MIVRMGLLTRKPGIATEQFRRHWSEVHGPLAAQLPGLRRYHQNHIISSLSQFTDTTHGDWHLDGISELWFDDPAAMGAAIASDAYRAVAADEPNCMVNSKAIVVEQNVIVPFQSGDARRFVKCMCFLIRARGVDAEVSGQRWSDVDAAVARLPGLVGYTRNVVVARMAAGAPAAYEAIPVDGVGEIWFHDGKALHAAIPSRVDQNASICASDRKGMTPTWQVEVNAVV